MGDFRTGQRWSRAEGMKNTYFCDLASNNIVLLYDLDDYLKDYFGNLPFISKENCTVASERLGKGIKII
jgi:hypothetical protein